MNNDEQYQKIINLLKRRKKGATAADVCAATALPLAVVRELLPKAADEYSGHLQVTQSGEILYYFPDGYSSRYRGFSAGLKKAFGIFKKTFKAALVFLFKVWIMLMLVGYFVLFVLLALASVVLLAVVQSKSSGNDNRRGAYFGTNLFSLIWRVWFFSELTKPRYGNYNYGAAKQNKKESRPMHKAIFSFVFGEEAPNANWQENEDRAVIAYIQSNRGVICLAEYMALSGKNSGEAEEAIISFCVRFSGSPEVTEEGAIVYRFDDLMLRADSKNISELSPPVKRLKTFSFNSKSKNTWFIIINAVNFFFGSYFLYNSINTGLLVSEIQYQSASYLYAFTHIIMELFVNNPHAFILVILGIVPFVFSILFWIIPALRKYMETRENENIKLENFKKFAFSKLWHNPLNVELKNFTPQSKECRPKEILAAQDRVIKDIGAIFSPEIETDENGKTVYSFKGLENEKSEVNKYRKSLDPSVSKLGDTVFDSGR